MQFLTFFSDFLATFAGGGAMIWARRQNFEFKQEAIMMGFFSGTISSASRQRGGLDPSFALGLAVGSAAGIATAVALPVAAKHSGLWDLPYDGYLTAVSALSSTISVGSLVAQAGRFRENPCMSRRFDFEIGSFAVSALVAAIGVTAAKIIMQAWTLTS